MNDNKILEVSKYSYTRKENDCSSVISKDIYTKILLTITV